MDLPNQKRKEVEMTDFEFSEGDTQVFVEYERRARTVSIWVNERFRDGDYNIHFDKDGALTKTLMSPGTVGDDVPFLILPYPLDRIIFKAMATYLDSAGIKVENKHKIEGELEAQTKHLDDMRAIVKDLIFPLTRQTSSINFLTNNN